MRSYDQYCALAQALDVVGDRWTLLIVRELLARERCRYTDLRYGLPGIATNLLAERLRELEERGIVTREDAPPPIAATLFRLTPRGQALRPVLTALGEWGEPLLADTPSTAEFRTHWLVLPLERLLVDHDPEGPAVAVEVRTGDQPIVIRTVDGRVRVESAAVPAPDATLEGSPQQVLGVLFGRVDLDAAQRDGLRFDGDRGAVERIVPDAPLFARSQDGF